MKRPSRRSMVMALAGFVIVLAVFYGLRWFLSGRRYVSTDDAFIDAHVVAMSPRVASNVTRVLVDDNVHVKAGDLLVELDPRDQAAQLAQASADLASAQAQHEAALINVRLVTTTSSAGVRQAEADVRLAQRQLEAAQHRVEEAHAQTVSADAELVRAQAEAARYQRLLQSGAVSRQEADNALAAGRTAQAQLEAAHQAEQAAAAAVRQQGAQVEESRARLASARAAPDQVKYSRAQAEQAASEIAQRRAAVREAELELSYTKLRAPTSGRVTRRTVARGDFVQVGQTLLSLVPDSVFVVANYKETQLRRIRPGQPATVKVDAYPDIIFHGRVHSIQRGSGAAFSLLPPENATGNFVKVVQRVPVKIVIAMGKDTVHVLGPGMSVEPRVKVR